MYVCVHMHQGIERGWQYSSHVLRTISEPIPLCPGICPGPIVLSFAEGSEQEYRANGSVLAGVPGLGQGLRKEMSENTQVL